MWKIQKRIPQKKREREENKKTRQTYFSVFYLVPNQHSHMTGCACRIRQEAVTHLSERFVGNVVVRDLLPLLLLFYHTNYFQRQLAVVLQWKKIQRKKYNNDSYKISSDNDFSKMSSDNDFWETFKPPCFCPVCTSSSECLQNREMSAALWRTAFSIANHTNHLWVPCPLMTAKKKMWRSRDVSALQSVSLSGVTDSVSLCGIGSGTQNL